MRSKTNISQLGTATVRIPQQRGPEGRRDRSPRGRNLPLLPLTIAGGVLLAGLGVGAAVVDQHLTSSTHQIRTPVMAGGLLRDPQAEQDLATRLTLAQQQFRAQFPGRLAGTGAVAYDQPFAGAGRPAGPVVFLGVALNTHGDPRDFVAAFRSGSVGYRVTEVDAGPGARGVCAETATSGIHRTYCAWSTGDSVGELVPTVAGWDTTRLASLMRAMRPDVEHPL
ncbi:MAG: hypothetical protein M3Y66_00060 [Actinomycetota bacterium]|nr:hypothetical protein [Actinomycetota bacterium]